MVLASLDKWRYIVATPEQNVGIMMRYLECLDDGDYEAANALLKDDFKHNLDRGGMETGINSSNDAMKRAQELGALDVKVLDVFASGDKVVGRYTYTISSDKVPGAQPGKTVKVSGIAIARIEDGQIAQVWHQQDVLDLLLKLGFTLQPAS